jgi:hypothetical protein
MVLKGNEFTQIFRLTLGKLLAFICDFAGYFDDFLAVFMGIEPDYTADTED